MELNYGATSLPTAGEGSVPQWLGIYPASVFNNVDPLALGRVQLSVPMVLGSSVSSWAPSLAFYDQIPPVNTQLSVMFLGGDINYPYWVWNEQSVNPSGSGLNPNPYFLGGTASGWVADGSGVFSVTNTIPAGSPYFWAGFYTGSADAVQSGGQFAVTAGQQYYLTAYVNTTTASSVNYGFAWYDNTGTRLTDFSTSVGVTSGTWQQIATVATAPAGAVTGAPKIGVSTGSVYFQAVIVYSQIPGGLIQTGTITANQIAANTITANNIKAGTITGIYTGAAYFGQNMIQDPAFSSSILNAVRTGDALTTGTWTLSGGTASVAGANPVHRLSLMPSGQPDFFCTPGEQFYMQVTVNAAALSQAGIEMVFNTGAVVSITANLTGTQTVTGSVTVPAGASNGYIRLAAFTSTGSPTIVFSNPAVYIGQLIGPDYVINQNGAFFYSGTPANGNLTASMTSASGTDQFGNLYGQGVYSYAAAGAFAGLGATAGAAVLQLEPGSSTHVSINAQIFATNSNPGLVNEAEWLVVSSGKANSHDDAAIQLVSATNDNTTPARTVFEFGGTPVLTLNKRNLTLTTGNGTGVSGTPDISQVDTTDDTNTNNGTQPCTMMWNIPADDAQVGTVYEVETSFNGTTDSTTTASMGFKPGLNGASVTTSGGDVMANSLFGTSVGFAGSVRVRMVIISTGVSGTASFFVMGGVGQNTAKTSSNSAVLSSQATGVTINTTVSNTLGIRSVWGSSQTNQTVVAHGSTFTRKGP